MNCPKCQFANSESAKFRNECGHSLILASRSTPQILSLTEPLEMIQRYLLKTLTDFEINRPKARDY